MKPASEPRTETQAKLRASLCVERLDSVAALDERADAWNVLAASAPAPFVHPFITPAWVASHLERKLRARERGACYLAWEGAQLVGVLPVVREPSAVFGTWRPRLGVPAEFYTRNGDILLAPGREAAVLRALVDAVDHREPPFLGLRFGGVREGSPTLEALRQALVGPTFVEHDMDGRLLAVNGAWGTHHDTLGRNFRRNLRKARSRVRSAGGKFHVLQGADAPADRLPSFLALEAGGWKGHAKQGRAVARSARGRSFYEALVPRLARDGVLEWHGLELEDRWVAAHLAIRVGHNRVLMRIAYDEAYRRFSPGNVLLAEVFERSFDDGDVDFVDCVTDQPWHDNWNMGRIGYHTTRIFRNSPVSRLLGAAPARVRAIARRWPLARRLVRRLRAHDA